MTYKMDNIMQHLMVIRPIISYWGIDKLLALLRCKDDEGKRLKKGNLVASHISGITFIRYIYTQSQKIGKPNNFLGLIKLKGLNWPMSPMTDGGEP